MPKKIQIDPVELHRLYHEEGLSIAKTAMEFDCSAMTIYNRMVEHGIPRRTANQDKNPVQVDCANCGRSKRIPPSHYDRFERFFCDNQCQGKFLERTGAARGKNNGRWKGRVSVDCANCGKELEVYPCRITEKDNHLCDQDCRAEWYSNNLSGENHPLWQGEKEHHYNGVWSRVRNRVRTRDGIKCQCCGQKDDLTERAHDVHHIQPIKSFEDPQEAHSLENLIQLCRTCHIMMEGLPPGIQRRIVANSDTDD